MSNFADAVALADAFEQAWSAYDRALARVGSSVEPGTNYVQSDALDALYEAVDDAARAYRHARREA